LKADRVRVDMVNSSLALRNVRGLNKVAAIRRVVALWQDVDGCRRSAAFFSVKSRDQAFLTNVANASMSGTSGFHSAPTIELPGLGAHF
jgi:hypothetical protein